MAMRWLTILIIAGTGLLASGPWALSSGAQAGVAAPERVVSCCGQNCCCTACSCGVEAPASDPGPLPPAVPPLERESIQRVLRPAPPLHERQEAPGLHQWPDVASSPALAALRRARCKPPRLCRWVT